MAKKNDLVTKTYLDKRLDRFKNELKDDLREFKDDLAAEMKNDLYEIKDEIVGEIQDMRQEFKAHLVSHKRIDDELEDHEERISALEPATA